jgi:hypothetical protein
MQYSNSTLYSNNTDIIHVSEAGFETAIATFGRLRNMRALHYEAIRIKGHLPTPLTSYLSSISVYKYYLSTPLTSYLSLISVYKYICTPLAVMISVWLVFGSERIKE